MAKAQKPTRRQGRTAFYTIPLTPARVVALAPRTRQNPDKSGFDLSAMLPRGQGN